MRLRATLKEKLNTKHVFQVTNPHVNAKMAQLKFQKFKNVQIGR